MYPKEVFLISLEDDLPASSVAGRIPQVSPQLFDVHYYLHALSQIEDRLSLLRRESAASVMSRAWVNRQARHVVQSSSLMLSQSQLQSSLREKESHHQACIADYQKQLAEASSLQQWRKIAEIVERIGELESEHESQQSTLTSSLQSLDQQRQAKRDKLNYYADYSRKLTEPLMMSQRAQIMALLQQRITLCEEMTARAHALINAAQLTPRVILPRPATPPPLLDPAAQVEKLLLHVAYGEQDEAEALIRTNPSLLLGKGTVTDYSNRTFNNITAFQLALWAYDWHMWQMLTRYLPQANAQDQLRELESQGTAYGKHYDFSELQRAYKTYIDNYDPWTSEQLNKHWKTVIGKLQTQVPAHVAQEYCRPDRSFEPTPSFKEPALPRTFKFDEDEDAWYPLGKMNYGFLGVDFGVLKATGAEGEAALGGVGASFVRLDFSAVAELCKVRTAQYEELKALLR